MTWLYLALAILAEVLATSLLGRTEGFTRPYPTVAVVGGYGVAFFFLAHALKGMEVGTAYAVWSGVGTALIAGIGIMFLGETVDAAKIIGVALVVAGVVVLNLGAAH